jgi:spore maturation protein SpmB
MDQISLKMLMISGFMNSIGAIHGKALEIVGMDSEGPKTYTVQIS